jgi:hypothetical protein
VASGTARQKVIWDRHFDKRGAELNFEDLPRSAIAVLLG